MIMMIIEISWRCWRWNDKFYYCFFQYTHCIYRRAHDILNSEQANERIEICVMHILIEHQILTCWFVCGTYYSSYSGLWPVHVARNAKRLFLFRDLFFKSLVVLFRAGTLEKNNNTRHKCNKSWCKYQLFCTIIAEKLL